MAHRPSKQLDGSIQGGWSGMVGESIAILRIGYNLKLTYCLFLGVTNHRQGGNHCTLLIRAGWLPVTMHQWYGSPPSYCPRSGSARKEKGLALVCCCLLSTLLISCSFPISTISREASCWAQASCWQGLYSTVLDLFMVTFHLLSDAAFPLW